ncbi:glucuronate isomerase [Microbacterium sp. P5_E9]
MPLSHRRDPDRLFPVDAGTRSIARDLYDRVAAAPIISPHGHVAAAMLDANLPFSDAAELLVTKDHYVTRLLHAAGVPAAAFGLGPAAAGPREIWRTVADHWHLFAGTASGYWIEEALSSVFGIDDPFRPDTADAIYDEIGRQLALPGFRPRALLERFRIDVLATTDDPLDDLAHHAALRGSGVKTRILPTFRPDQYLDPDAAQFADRVPALLAATGQPTTFAGYLAALEARRAHFVAHGAVSTDHGVQELFTADLEAADAARLFQQVLAGTADAAQRRLFRGHMLLQMARMSVDDGLVMTIHPGVLRNHSTTTLERLGPDTGHDIPVPTGFTHGIRPLLEKYGLEPGLHVVLFTVDETNYSREIAPLAGFYPSLFIGAPWWFLDAPDAITRFRSAVTETAGFYRGAGFIDDTRAFASIPARHDTARRVDAAFLARYVAEGRIAMPVAERIADDLVDAIPRKAFKL